MKLITALILGLGLTAAYAEETKTINANGHKIEARVPKSSKIDCKVKENADKTECKKQPKEMPKIDKPVVEKKPDTAKK